MSVTIPIAKKETWIADALRLEKTTITKDLPSNVNLHYATHVFPTIVLQLMTFTIPASIGTCKQQYLTAKER